MELIFLFGGCSGDELINAIQILNPITYQWTVSQLTVPETVFYYAAAEVNGLIYLLGGANHQQFGLKSNWVFDPLFGKWSSKEPMLESRCFAASVVYDGKIAVMGGLGECTTPRGPMGDSGSRTRTVEMLADWLKLNIIDS